MGEVELRKQGNFKLYDVANNRIHKINDIDSLFQNDIYGVVEYFYKKHTYNYDDRCEILVNKDNKVIAHLKVQMKERMILDYKLTNFILDEYSYNQSIKTGEYYDKMQVNGKTKKVNSYMKNFINGSVYHIIVSMASNKTPKQDLKQIAEDISYFIPL